MILIYNPKETNFLNDAFGKRKHGNKWQNDVCIASKKGIFTLD